MTWRDSTPNLTFHEPVFRLPALQSDLHRLPEPWQIVIYDAEERRAYFTKWKEDHSLEGLASPNDATQFDFKTGVLVGLHKAAELRDTQFNPDRLYIVDGDRTSMAQFTLDS